MARSTMSASSSRKNIACRCAEEWGPRWTAVSLWDTGHGGDDKTAGKPVLERCWTRCWAGWCARASREVKLLRLRRARRKSNSVRCRDNNNESLSQSLPRRSCNGSGTLAATRGRLGAGALLGGTVGIGFILSGRVIENGSEAASARCLLPNSHASTL